VWVKEQIGFSAVPIELGRLAPSELLVCRSGPYAKKVYQLSNLKGTAIKLRADESSEVGSGGRAVANILGYGGLGPSAKKAVRLLLNYLDETTVDVSVTINEVTTVRENSILSIDSATRVNLELVRNSRDGGMDGTLLQILDHTKTPLGARLLKSSILNPLVDVNQIQDRLEAVRFLKTELGLRNELSDILKFITDVERVAARVELKSAMPRELGALRDSIEVVPALRRVLLNALVAGDAETVRQLKTTGDLLEVSPELAELLSTALLDEVPLSSSDGGIIRDGHSSDVDRLREIKRTGRSWIADLEAQEKVTSGIGSLKIRYNNVLGFFFEVTKTNLSKVPSHFIRRQSTVTGDRFTTVELQRREEEVLGAEGKLCKLERELFESLRQQVCAYTASLRALSSTIATLDMLLSLAEAADREDFVQPEITRGLELNIKNGRHPVVARILRGSFIPNSLVMKEVGKRCFVITGPNMGGKSTFLRQAAILVIMAQMGSFVAADSAEVGVVDKIFARIGASDNMAEGESTFMVEMREAAHIVANATNRSLLLIDEIGRGTATSDGLSIARSILEWFIVETKCRTLFATHYHELTALDETYLEVGNLSVGSTDVDGQVVFTHQIQAGPASKSYGLEVARIAGLPENLINRARVLLNEIERKQEINQDDRTRQLSFFRDAPAAVTRQKVVEPSDYPLLSRLKRTLTETSVDDITPRKALEILAQIKTDLSQG